MDRSRPTPVWATRIPTSTSPASDNVEEDYADIENLNCGQFFSCGKLDMYCFGIILGLWLLGSVILTDVIYGTEEVWLGPHSSILLEPSSIFVKSIKVKELGFAKPGLQLYGFYGSPPLDRFLNWSDSRVLPVSHDSYKGWPYYLNQGSSMNISYSVMPKGSEVQLAISEGMRGISRSSLDETAFGETTWSWNLIQGSGMINLEISKSSTYYLTVANLKRKDVEVELNIDVRAVLYDTTKSFYNCTFTNGECTFDVTSLAGNSVVITSPAPSQGGLIEDAWLIWFSYQPRWIGYVTFTVLVIRFILVVIQLCNRLLQCCGGEGHQTDNDSARTPLLENSDYDDSTSSMGSFNVSFASDDADFEEFMRNDGEASNRTTLFIRNDVEASNRTRRLCAISRVNPEDCFFLPCDNCVSTVEDAGKSHMCPRIMKKVKRSYSI